MVENTHKVPLKQWKKWGDLAKQVFNGVYEDIQRMGPACFCHPEAEPVMSDHFATIAWNAAWTAADQVQKPGSVTVQIKNLAA